LKSIGQKYGLSPTGALLPPPEPPVKQK